MSHWEIFWGIVALYVVGVVWINLRSVGRYEADYIEAYAAWSKLFSEMREQQKNERENGHD